MRCSRDAHRPRCRRDRPLCRWRRAAYAAQKFAVRGPCRCDAYHFPHRPGAGECRSRPGASGMPAILRAQLGDYAHERSRPEKTLCPRCGAVHRDHSRCS